MRSLPHPSCLARGLGKRFGDQAYAAEELLAEVGSAFLCADLSITPEKREDHAQYLATWLSILKSDSRTVFTAAAHAQRAVDHLHDLQPKPDPPDPSRWRDPSRGLPINALQ
jgi:antirestriction protein ArdC